MFVLSKIVGWFCVPTNLALVLLGISLAALMAGKRRLAFSATVATFAWIIGASMLPLGTILIRPLEERVQRIALPDRVSAIIVIGGGLESEISAARDIVELAGAADRLTEGVRLARQFPDARLVYTGGTGLVSGGISGAEIAQRFFIEQGIEPGRIVVEGESRNTHENVVFTKRILEPKADETHLFVTSAFHMPRTLLLFQSSNWDALPWPVDYRTRNPRQYIDQTRSVIDNLSNVELAMKEWVGLFSYRVLGRTQKVLPEPSQHQQNAPEH